MLLLVQQHDFAIERWSRIAVNTSLVTSLVADKGLTGARLLIDSMQDWVREEEIRTPDDLVKLAGTHAFHDKLERRTRMIVGVDGALLIAADGRIVNTIRSFPPPPVSLADRDYFRAQMAPTALAPTLSLGVVVDNRVNDRVYVYLAHRITATDGTALGVAFVALNASDFVDLFRTLRGERGSVVRLLRQDGVVLASTREQEIGTRMSCASDVLDTIGNGKWAIRDSRQCFGGGLDRAAIAAPRTLGSFPLLTLTTIGDEVYLGDYRRSATWIIAVAGILTLLLAAFAHVATRLDRNARAVARLTAERQLLGSIVDAPLGVTAVVEADGTVSFANRQFRALATDSLEAGNLLRSPRITGLEPLRELLSGACTTPIELDLRFRQTGSPPRLARLAASPTVLGDGRIRAVLFGFDETERRLADAAIAQSAKLITLGEMSTGMAHELNQPLNVIKICAQSALQETGDQAPPPFVAEQLTRIGRQVDRAASLIRHMRIFGRAPIGPAQVVDMRDVCQGVADLVAGALRGADVALELELGEQPLPVHGHTVLFEQAVMNLVLNARDALVGAGTADPRVRVVTAAAGDGRMSLRVSDNGPGIPEAIRDRLFEPFFTTKPIGQGTGLGLSIAYGIVRDAGGRLSHVPSDAGTVFEIDLPLAATKGKADVGRIGAPAS